MENDHRTGRWGLKEEGSFPCRFSSHRIPPIVPVLTPRVPVPDQGERRMKDDVSSVD